LEAGHPAATEGGVAFSGRWETGYRVNLWSRLASRVLWKLTEFDYANESDVYEGTRKLAWEKHFGVDRTLRVNLTAIRSPLKSLDFTTLRIKDAICDRFREVCDQRPSIERLNPDVRVHAFLSTNRATLYLDTSGEPLFRRGGRAAVHPAPLRENLAAGIIKLTGWRPEEPLLDPMCGGATLLIEAAAMARNRAPGLKRSFGFERLRNFDAKLWTRLLKEAAVPLERAPKLALFGSDSDPGALSAARRNLAEAGVERWVTLECSDVLTRGAPAGAGVLVANPPYGERIGSPEELARFYPKLGDALKRNFAGWRCHIFTADLRLPKLIRLEPSRRVPLFNGALDCRLYEFRIVEGSHRRPKPSNPSDDRPPGQPPA